MSVSPVPDKDLPLPSSVTLPGLGCVPSLCQALFSALIQLIIVSKVKCIFEVNVYLKTFQKVERETNNPAMKSVLWSGHSRAGVGPGRGWTCPCTCAKVLVTRGTPTLPATQLRACWGIWPLLSGLLALEREGEFI